MYPTLILRRKKLMGPNFQHHSLFRNGINITSYTVPLLFKYEEIMLKSSNVMPKSQTHTKCLGTSSLGFLQHQVHFFF